jgi:hypothetical protein
MKKIVVTLLLFISFIGYSQTNGITYQAVILNPSGDQLPGVNNTNAPLANKYICLKFSIIDQNSQFEYIETVQTTTDEFGMVNLIIGTGDQIGGYASSFSTILWNANPKSLKVDLSTTGVCSDYTEISNQPFTAVPFALFAATAGTPGTPGPAGPQGIQGVAGPTGATGATGPVGPQGPIGLTGATGSQGLPGIQGVAGPTGATGAIGPVGPQGAQGIAGSNGTNGVDGAVGATGLQGLQGIQGVAGPIGPVGPQGPIGLTGATGSQGLPGIQGVAGPTGATGAIGPVGPQGAQGLPGTNGTNGTNGVDGAVGATGSQGIQGIQGVAGPIGAQGLPGTNGTNGSSAYQVALTNGFVGSESQWLASLAGATGATGAAGTNGTNGSSAFQVAVTNGFVGTEAQWLASLVGTQGPAGATGLTGPQGIAGTNGSDASVTIGAINSTSDPKGATITAGELKLAPADASNGGIVTTGTQTFGGSKIFSSDILVNGITVGNGAGNEFNTKLNVLGSASFRTNVTNSGLIFDGYSPSGSLEVSRIYTDATSGTPSDFVLGTYPNAHSNQLYLKQSNGFVGIKTANPTTALDVNGTVTATSFIKRNGLSTEYLMADGSVSNGSSTTVGAINSTSDPKGATITAGELKLAPADATNGGIVTTGTQTFGGSKTFNSNVIGNLSGNATTATNIAGGSLGQIPYQNSSNTTSFLPADTSTSRKFLSSIGSNGNATAPTWQPIRPSDIISSSSSVSGNLNFETSIFGSQSWTELDTQWNITQGWANLRDYNGTAYQGSYSINAPDSQDFTLQSSKDFNLTSLFIMGGGMNTATSIEFKGYTAAGVLVGSVIVNTSAFNFNFSNVNLNFSGIRKLVFHPIGFDPNAMGGGSFFLDYFSVTFATSNNLSSVNGILKSNGNGEITAAVSGTDFLAPTGSAAGLTNFPTLNQNTTGTAANVSGVVAIANGGTAATTAAEALTNLGAAPIDSPTFTGVPLAPTAAPGTNTTQIATTAFVTNAVSAATNGGATSVGAISSSSDQNGASINAGVLNLAPADASNGGIVTTGTQTFAGAKTFSDGLTVINKPFLPTKLNQSQISSLSNVEEGMVVYNTDTRKLQIFSVGNTDTTNELYSGNFSTERDMITQSFVPQVSGSVYAFQFFAKKVITNNPPGGNGYLVVNYPGGSESVDLTSLTTSGEWISINLDTPISVVAGASYNFSVWSYTLCIGEVILGTNSNYSNGSIINSYDGCDNPGALNGDDLMFRVLITPSSTSAYWLNLN